MLSIYRCGLDDLSMVTKIMWKDSDKGTGANWSDQNAVCGAFRYEPFKGTLI